jgi:enoyl-CoA hydratase/carnithine racemase
VGKYVLAHAYSPSAVKIGRRLVRDAVALSEAEAWKRTAELAGQLMRTGDGIEGATAFAEKRDPVWGDPIDLD